MCTNVRVVFSRTVVNLFAKAGDLDLIPGGQEDIL